MVLAEGHLSSKGAGARVNIRVSPALGQNLLLFGLCTHAPLSHATEGYENRYCMSDLGVSL
jgi:hypothetical protein